MNTQDQPRRLTHSLWLSLLFILALLMSLRLMLLLAQLALPREKQEWLKASVLTELRADYSPDDWVELRRFAPLSAESIDKTAEEVGRDENSSLAPIEPVGSQADSPQFVPVYEWPSD